MDPLTKQSRMNSVKAKKAKTFMMKLYGSYHGHKDNVQPYKKCHIEYSKLADKTYHINWITLTKNRTGVLGFFIYHSFDLKDDNYGGRWYDKRGNIDKFEWDLENQSITYKIPEYKECEDTNNETVRKDVPITIKFNDNGWKKIKKFMDKIIEIDMKQMERSTSGVAKRSSKSNNDADDMQKLIE